MKNLIKAERLRRENERLSKEKWALWDKVKARQEGYREGTAVTKQLQEFAHAPLMEQMMAEAAREFAKQMVEKIVENEVPRSVVHSVSLDVWKQVENGLQTDGFTSWIVQRRWDGLCIDFRFSLPAIKYTRRISDDFLRHYQY